MPDEGAAVTGAELIISGTAASKRALVVARLEGRKSGQPCNPEHWQLVRNVGRFNLFGWRGAEALRRSATTIRPHLERKFGARESNANTNIACQQPQ